MEDGCGFQGQDLLAAWTWAELTVAACQETWRVPGSFWRFGRACALLGSWSRIGNPRKPKEQTSFRGPRTAQAGYSAHGELRISAHAAQGTGFERASRLHSNSDDGGHWGVPVLLPLFQPAPHAN